MNNQNLFDKYRDGNHWENHRTIYAEYFANFLKEKHKENISSKVIVDLGCGNGRDVNVFYNISPLVVGIDILDAEKRYNRLGFRVENIERLTFPFETIDAYFCINVMHYVDAPKVLREIYRTLHPGGYAFIHFNLLIIDQDYLIDYHQKKSDVYKLVKHFEIFEIVEEKIFLRDDALPTPHTHHIMQVILKKN
jgi:SAM-dependent methyltransferase